MKIFLVEDSLDVSAAVSRVLTEAESTAFTVTWADLQHRLLTGAPT